MGAAVHGGPCWSDWRSPGSRWSHRWSHHRHFPEGNSAGIRNWSFSYFTRSKKKKKCCINVENLRFPSKSEAIDCVYDHVLVLSIYLLRKKKITTRKGKKNTFACNHCSDRSARHCGKSLVTLRLKCGPGKSRFRESFSRNSSAAALILTSVGTSQSANGPGVGERGSPGEREVGGSAGLAGWGGGGSAPCNLLFFL